MNFDRIILPLRIVQGLLALLVFALCAYVASWYNSRNLISISPSQVNFLIFSGVWTLLIALPYIFLAPRFFPAGAHKFILLGIEAVTMIFWFAGFIALAAGLGALEDIEGAWCGGSVCDSMKASAAFGAFEWLAFAISTVIVGMGALRSPAPVQPHQGV